MSRVVNTGWRTVRPGDCDCCGFDDGWQCDGRGHVYCDCQQCPGCGAPPGEGHGPGCEEAAPDFEEYDADDHAA